MKKGIVHLLMLMVVSLSLGTVFSCKDYDEDRFQQLNYQMLGENATLKDVLQKQKLALDSLKDQVDTIKSCGCEAMVEDVFGPGFDFTAILNKLKDQTDAIDNAIAGANNSGVSNLEELLDLIFDNDATLTNVNNTLILVQENLDYVEALAKEDSVRIDELRDAFNGFKGTVNTRFGLISDSLRHAYETADYAKQKADANYNLLTALETRYENDSVQIRKELKDSVNKLRLECEANLKAAKDYTDLQVKEVTKALADSMVKVWAVTNGLQNQINTLTTAVNNRIDKTNGRIDSLNNELADHIAAFDAYVDSTDTKLGKLNDAIKDVETKLQDQIDDLVERMDAAEDKIDELYTRVETAEGAIEALQTYVDGIVDRLNLVADSVKANNDSIVKILARMGIVETRLDTVETRLNAVETRVDSIVSALKALEGRVDTLENSAKKLITNITINETDNPLFGTFNLPLGIQSNMLLAYYGEGKNTGSFEFPAKKGAGCHIDEAHALTAEDFARMGSVDTWTYNGGGYIFDGENNQVNLGTVYMTVNPTKVDFTGTEFDLVNSLDEQAPARLGAIKPSTHKISFGMKRNAQVEGSAANGFYESQVTLPAAKINQGAIRSEGIKEAVSRFIKGAQNALENKSAAEGTFNISGLANTIYNNIGDITDAQAVKATWNDPLIGDRSVYSQYGIASGVIKCHTSYSSFNDFHYQTMPGYEQAVKFIDRIAGSVKNTIASMWPDLSQLDPNKITIKDVTYTPGTFDELSVDFALQIQADYIYDDVESGYLVIQQKNPVTGELQTVIKIKSHDDDLGVTIEKRDDTTFRLKYTFETDNMSSQVQKVYDAIEEAFGDVNETYDSFKDFLDDVNSLLNDMNAIDDKITDKVDTFAGKLKEFLDKINNGVVGFVNGLKYKTKPTLVSVDDYGTYMISPAKSYATGIHTSTSFVLTNRFAELIAPAVKKHIAVTNVYNMDGTPVASPNSLIAAVNNSSKQMNAVLPGRALRVEASGFQKGYIYEVSYTGMDYEGNQYTNRFYVTVR